MELIYSILESIFPFHWIQYNFMKNAFIAVCIITPLFGLLGTMIVNNRLAFFSDALGHSAFTGIAIGVIFGITDTNITMMLFAVLFALALNQIKRRNTVSTDTVISVFSSLGTAVGLVILSSSGDFSKYSNLLVGDILNISEKEIFMLVLIFVVTILFWGFCFNQLHAVSVNETLAKSKGMKTKLIDNIFVVLIALIIMLSIKWVGILLINALLILPAASARNLASDMREYHLFSIMISVFCGIFGLIFSYYNNTVTGPTIVIIASVIFFVTLICKPFAK